MKLPKGLIDHDGARLFGMKDIEAVVRDCARVCDRYAPSSNMYIVGKAFEREILDRYGLSPLPAPDEEKRG